MSVAVTGGTVMEGFGRANAGNWFVRYLLLACLMLLSPMVTAAKVSDLYQVDVPVNGQERTERDQAVSRAMSEVLVRVTGQRKALAHPAIKAELKRATNYLQGYSYSREEKGGQKQLLLMTSFDEQAITRLLREKGLAIWGGNRPTTLIWLAIQDGTRREIQGSGSNTALQGKINKVLDQRALPVIFPVMDFEDNLAISAVDVWGLFSSKLSSASSRYGSESVLGGRLAVKDTAAGRRYNGRLVLLFRNQRFDANIENLSAGGVALAMADLVGTTLSGHYAVTSGDGSAKLVLVISDISDTRAYAGAIAYVEGLTAVREATVRKVAGNQLELELTIDGTVDQLSDSIALERRLQQVASDIKPVSGSGQRYLHYRWQGRR